jgi:sulfopyruvate decarboxylase TPP-binding subunit
MWDGPAVLAALRDCGITHVIWVPDSTLGQWEPALSQAADLRLIRVCREGEAMAVAAGLMLGGKRPVVMIQCTGLFEAGDSLRNVVHDLKLPLFLVVGVRSYFPHQLGASTDSCPVFTEPILQAWRLPYVLLQKGQGADALAAAYRQAQQERRAGAVLIPEGGP